MKKILLLLLCNFLITFVLAQGSTENLPADKSSFTLEECIRYAETYNYTLQSAALDVTASELSLKSAKEHIAPSVSASASQGLNTNHYLKSVGWIGNYGINAGMTLFIASTTLASKRILTPFCTYSSASAGEYGPL